MSARVLVTGGAGYIGSHTCVELLRAGLEVVVLDNLSNGRPEALDGVKRITGTRPLLVEADIRDAAALREAMAAHRPDSVIHFAGLKAVGESVEHPLRYYQNNVAGSINLVEAMQATDCRNIVFSSSCTVYGDPEQLPISESAPVGGTSSPYGLTKHLVELLLMDLQAMDPRWNVSLLRYFNPVGAHPSGEIGEDPSGLADNLMPYVCKVASGQLDKLSVYGGDYPTRDGTCIRDYLHVCDLATGHLAALRRFDHSPGLMIHNLGTGRGYSVLELIEAFEAACERPVPYEIGARRPGDITRIWADPSLAEEELGWRAERDLAAMCRDAWNWQMQHPFGYTGA